ncbi:MAG: hypothetical protein IJD92_00010 [Bacilli bacterium]|nr:hypothetical protein [Bacilli bacterium]MBQ3511785.1 hypothetical protein [Bacilli bacterium]
MNFTNEWIEEKILKKPSNKNYEDYPNQMRKELEIQAKKFDFEIFSYTKDHYLMSAILKDKTEDRFISVMTRELSCFKDRMYRGVEIRYMKNSKMVSRTVVTSVSWNEIGITARRLIECRKNLENRNREEKLQKKLEEELER